MQSFCTPKGEIRQPPFKLASICSPCSTVGNLSPLLSAWSRKIDLLDQRSGGKKNPNQSQTLKSIEISNPKIKYRLLLVPTIAFRKSNKHRLLARKSEVYVIHKILRLLLKVMKCSKDYKWPQGNNSKIIIIKN